MSRDLQIGTTLYTFQLLSKRYTWDTENSSICGYKIWKL